MESRVSMLSVWWMLFAACMALLAPMRAQAQAVPGNNLTEPLEVQQLRALRAEQTARYQRVRVLVEQERDLKREDSELYPVTFPLIMMGAGFGASAIGLGLLVLNGFNSCNSRCQSGDAPNTRSRELDRAVLVTEAFAAPLGLTGLILCSYRVHMRPNRERVRELRQERRGLQRQFREEDRENRDAWSFIPDASMTERRAGLSIRHAF